MGPFQGQPGPCEYTDVSPIAAQQNAEPLTLQEPFDHRFGEKQHPVVDVMQQAVQRETVHPEGGVQGVET